MTLALATGWPPAVIRSLTVAEGVALGAILTRRARAQREATRKARGNARR